MKLQHYLYFLIFVIFAAACKKENILADGKDIKLDYGFTMSVEDEDFQIHFDEVVEDSRCPLGSFCAWPGRAKVRIITISGGSEKTYEFSSLAPIQMDTIFENGNDRYEFKLLEINPFPDNDFHPLETYSIEFNLKLL